MRRSWKEKNCFYNIGERMRKASLVFLMGMVLLVGTGCAQNKTRVAEGAGIGGVLGATLGGIIGYQSGHPVEGALIGGAVGAGGGATVGSQIDKPETRQEQAK